jgi:hypothetical protein
VQHNRAEKGALEHVCAWARSWSRSGMLALPPGQDPDRLDVDQLDTADFPKSDQPECVSKMVVFEISQSRSYLSLHFHFG